MDIAVWPHLCLWHAHTVWIAPMPWRSVTGWSPMPVPVFSGRSIFFSCLPGRFRRKTCDLPRCLSACPAWPQLLSHCLCSVAGSEFCASSCVLVSSESRVCVAVSFAVARELRAISCIVAGCFPCVAHERWKGVMLHGKLLVPWWCWMFCGMPPFVRPLWWYREGLGVGRRP